MSEGAMTTFDTKQDIFEDGITSKIRELDEVIERLDAVHFGLIGRIDMFLRPEDSEPSDGNKMAEVPRRRNSEVAERIDEAIKRIHRISLRISETTEKVEL